jgi:hypothetical protein
MDAMSEAVDNADVMLYGVSLLYKESGNVSGTCNPQIGLCEGASALQ